MRRRDIYAIIAIALLLLAAALSYAEPLGHSNIELAPATIPNRIAEELKLYSPNLEQIEKEVNNNIAMSSAYIQTVLRREGKSDAYDAIKKVSMGRKVRVEEYVTILDNLATEGAISVAVKNEIKNGLLPKNNIGNANKLADDAIRIAEKQVKVIKKIIKG